MHYSPIARPDANPFAPTRDGAGAANSPAFDRAVHQVMRRIGRSERLVPVLGAPGTGKTLLLAEIERRIGARATVRRLAGGDMLRAAADLPDVLLVDEGERADPRVLERVLGGGWSGTMVLACARDCLGGLPADWRARPETLRALRPREARAFARARLARSGNTGLVAPEALAALALASHGNSRALVQLGGTAVFLALGEGAAVVSADHVRAAVEMRCALDGGRPPAPPRRSRRPWQSVARVPAALRRHRTQAIAGAGAAVALALMLLGGIGERRAPVPAPVLVATRDASAPRPPPMDVRTPDTIAPAVTTPAAQRVDAPPTLLASAQPPQAQASARVVADRATTARAAKRAKPAARSDARETREPPALALARPIEVGAPPTIAPAAPVVAREPAVPALALAIPVRAPSFVARPTPPEEPSPDGDRTRRAAIAARDAMREMRAGRGG